MNEEEIDLREILAILGKRWWLILIITVAAVVISGVLSFYVIKPTYQASTSLIVSKSQTAQYNNGQIQFQDVQTNRLLASTYAEIATSRSVLQEAINKLNLNMTTDQLKKNIDVAEEGDTEVINISVKDNNPKTAADIANAVANSFVDNIVKIMKVDNVSVIDEAIPPTTKISPKPTLNMSIAAILGIMVSIFIIFLLEYFDKTYKSVDDVKKYLDLPVLGVIPELKD
ncbi:YveK family protein [Thermoanaerobacterium thermosaccharolyticum]|uniref:YveK family protein n=1 Tax=Thermoanaerobacterium thermosaccharolyticum TaxID=1517 RepID=UPI003D2DF6C6